MKNYLVREYRDEQGWQPFKKFDPECGFTEKGLLSELKRVAKEINRPDLITGQKKS